MVDKSYLVIQDGVVTNTVVWDGDTQFWTPPEDAIMLPQSSTPSMIWLPIDVNTDIWEFSLQEVVGLGQIGFIWDGNNLTTNYPQPETRLKPTLVI